MRLAGFLAAVLTLSSLAYSENWPQWRGPTLNGHSGEKNLPVKWSTEENIAWKLPMPDRSGATPIIWGEYIFLNVAEGEKLELWCVDRRGPSIVWKRSIANGNYKINKQNMSSPSPVTDGKNVWVLTGLGILKAFDFKGNELWMRDIQKDYGKFGLNWGYASSPLLFEDALYVQVLHGMRTDDPSYVLRIDKATGKTVWRTERPTAAIHESPDSYSTPQIVYVNKKPQLIVSGGDIVTAHDLASGKELWRGTGFNPSNNGAFRTIASSVVHGDVVYTPTRVRPLIAYRAGGQGDVTNTHKVFSFDQGPDVPTPLVDGKYLYSINDRGIAWCIDAKTGAEVYGGKRLKPAIYSASPVLADGKIYITSEEGLTTVLKAGPEFEILAENAFNDYTLSSPAISDGQIFIRTAGHLWCIGKRASK
jgi:outer membrane protein assembly factor BamB